VHYVFGSTIGHTVYQHLYYFKHFLIAVLLLAVFLYFVVETRSLHDLHYKVIGVLTFKCFLQFYYIGVVR
jgi:predicted branched-subunit amino acid permease